MSSGVATGGKEARAAGRITDLRDREVRTTHVSGGTDIGVCAGATTVFVFDAVWLPTAHPSIAAIATSSTTIAMTRPTQCSRSLHGEPTILRIEDW